MVGVTTSVNDVTANALLILCHTFYRQINAAGKGIGVKPFAGIHVLAKCGLPDCTPI
jgi:hypothetical protein